jgi:hypothetical protein
MDKAWIRLLLLALVTVALLFLAIRWRGLIFGLLLVLGLYAVLWTIGYLILRFIRAARLSGLQTAGTVLGMNTGYPAWSGTVPGDLVVFLGDGKKLRDIRSTDFHVPDDLAGILEEARASCDDQLAPILGGETKASAERRALQRKYEERLRRDPFGLGGTPSGS